MEVVVTPNCPNLCISDSEREERERKGDLDKYERLDGDRNQTSKYLAVKKARHTAWDHNVRCGYSEINSSYL